jgi:maleate isomerase
MDGDFIPDGGSARRIGLVLPSSNVVMEDLLQAPGLRERFRGTRFHVSRLPVEPVNLQAGSAAQFDFRALMQAAHPLADAKVDAIMWAGTAGLWLGLEHDRQLVGRLAAATGVPVSTTGLAVLAACHRLEATRIALLTPFVGEVQQAIVGVLAREGVEVCAEHHFGIGSSRSMADITEVEVAQAASRLALAGVAALCCVCTNMRVPATLVEGALGIPVIDSARESLDAMHTAAAL